MISPSSDRHGASVPVQVFDSNGSVHKELVKSRDDLRQDAVMQQLFSLVNELLLQDETARIRQLSVATYKASCSLGQGIWLAKLKRVHTGLNLPAQHTLVSTCRWFP